MASEPDSIDLLGFRVIYLHAEPGSRVALLEWRASPRAGGIPLHMHDRTDEGFYVLRGQLGLALDGEEYVRGAGSYTAVPAGHPHTFWNPTDEPAIYLTPIAPAGFEAYLRALARGLARAQSAAQAAELRARLGEQHDITVLGPPPRG